MGRLMNAPIAKKLSESQMNSLTNITLPETEANSGSKELSHYDDHNQTIQSNCNDSTNTQSRHFLESPKELECREPYCNNGVDLSTLKSEEIELIRKQLL